MRRYQWAPTVAWAVCVLTVSVVIGGCSPAQCKADADREVYGIVDSKRDDRFVSKVNYALSDSHVSPNDIRIERSTTPGRLSLAEAVARAQDPQRFPRIPPGA